MRVSSLQAALDLARRGLPVFPCADGGKAPAIERFPERATTDPARITGWWTDPFGAPDGRNIGIATGRGLVVVDADMKPGQHGARSLASLEAEGLPEDTFTVQTPSGGQHRYYRVPAGTRVPNSASKLAPNIDVRGEGGYVVAPGSVIGAGGYSIIRDAPIAEAPPWLLDRCGRARERSGDATVPLVDLDSPASVARAVEYLRHDAESAVEGAGGDAATYRVAAAVGDFGVSETACLELMLEHWNSRCSPPWMPDELGVKVENAYAHRQTAPGSASPEAEFGAVPLPPEAPGPPNRSR